MLRTVAIVAVAALAAVTGAAARTEAVPFRASLAATTHTPPVRSPWKWTVRVVGPNGGPARASLRVYVLDDSGRRINTVGWFGVKGTLTRTYRWQAFLRGERVTFQVVVISNGHRRTLNYWIKPL